MKLFYSPAACSLASHIALREAEIQFELERVSLPTKITETGMDFTSISAKGYVPALLLDNGELLTEGVAILLWVAEQDSHKALAPSPGTNDYIRLVEWLTFVATEVHKGFSPLFNSAVSKSAKEAFSTRLFSRLAYADSQLGSRPYLMGEGFGIADIYLFTTLRWLSFLHIDLDRWPNLAAFLTRVGERSAVKAALAAEGLN
jgi:glutathione S-transferase